MNQAIRCILACAGACALAVASRVDAQTLTGRVVLADSTTGLAGAIVVATDSRGIATRTLSASTGQYALRLPHAGVFAVTVLRIGYAPTVARMFDIAGGAPSHVVLFATTAPIVLPAMTSRGKTECRVRPDTGLVVAKVWEEARKAMLATQLSGADTTLVGEWMEYDRSLDSTNRVVRDQRVNVIHDVTSHVFKSRSADSLARLGYVIADSSGIAFFAPDANALLSDTFTDTHCFRLSARSDAARSVDTSNINNIGVSFEPVRSRLGMHDIEGTLWVDRHSAELRSLEFRYTKLADLPDSLAGGGRVEFARLTSGAWIVSAWYAQLPVMGPRDLATGVGRSITYTVNYAIVRSMHVTGGEVYSILNRNAIVLTRPSASMHVQLVSRDGSVPVLDANIVLRGTNLSASTDSSGGARIQPLPLGTYNASIVIPELDAFGASPVERVVKAHLGEGIETIELPPASAMLAKLCPANATTDGTAMLRGTVRTSNGAVVAGAQLTVAYQRVDPRGLKTGSVTSNEETLNATTDERGRWQLCGIPHEADLVVHARIDTRTDVRRLRIDAARVFTVVDLTVRSDSTSNR